MISEHQRSLWIKPNYLSNSAVHYSNLAHCSLFSSVATGLYHFGTPSLSLKSGSPFQQWHLPPSSHTCRHKVQSFSRIMLILLNQWISFGEDIVLCVLLRNTLKGLKSMLHMMNPALLSHQVFDIFSFFFFFSFLVTWLVGS